MLQSAVFLALPGLWRDGLDDIGLISFEEENMIGTQLFKQVLAEATVSRDRAATARVAKVLKRITTTKTVVPGRYAWESVVLSDDSVNAFALPGGKLAVYTGLLDFVRSDDELAVVIGHECAHVLERHGAKKIRNAMLAKQVEGAIAQRLGTLTPADRMSILGILETGASLGAGLPYSRNQESSADRVGLTLTAEAGYKPRAALAFWRRLAEANSGSPDPGLLSTHPSDAARIRQIEQLLKKMGV